MRQRAHAHESCRAERRAKTETRDPAFRSATDAGISGEVRESPPIPRELHAIRFARRYLTATVAVTASSLLCDAI